MIMENSTASENTNKDSGQGGLIDGDLFKGIAVSDFNDTEYEFDLDGIHVRVVQKTISTLPDRLCVGFLFLPEAPVRFRVDVLVPGNCMNARVALKDQELIPYFSKNIPSDPEPLITSGCTGHEKYSTLKPGEFQSINFKWEPGDILRFFFYFDYKQWV